MLAQQTRKQQTAKTTSLPASVKGLNARDAIASMPPDFALTLDNVFCTPTTVDIRNGSSAWVTGITGWVETIAHYVSPTKGVLIAAANNKIYDVTTTGAVGSAKVSGLTNNRWQWVNFATPGGNYIQMVNGADALVQYDGTTWSQVTGAITGLTTSTIIGINIFQSRIWYIPVNSLTPYYLPLNSISGAATAFPLGSIFQLGGYIMAMATWTVDNVSGGIQDYAVFVTSEGEVAIYQGYDPSFAATFTLVGMFTVGRPVGRRCFTKIASDNALICSDGLVSFSKELTTDRDQSQSFTYNIQSLISDDITSFRANFGWQVTYHPNGNKLILNVPAIENSQQYQYVMNTITGAWSTWNKLNNGYNATCWDVFEDVLYYGGNGNVYVGDTGMDDSGNGITFDIQPAYSYFGDLGQEKYFTLVRPIFLTSSKVNLSYILCVDYNSIVPTSPALSIGTGSPWGSPWNITPWTTASVLNKNWLGMGGIGYAASLRMKGQTKGISGSLQSIDYVYEGGGVL